MTPDRSGAQPQALVRCRGVTAEGKRCWRMVPVGARTGQFCRQREYQRHLKGDARPKLIVSDAQAKQERLIAELRARLDPGPLPLDGED